MRLYLKILLCLLFVLSCETWDYVNVNEFDFGDGQHTVQFFVMGGITTQNTYHQLELVKPVRPGADIGIKNISDARVYVSANSDTFHFTPVTTYWSEYAQDTIILESPFYKCVEKFAGIPGTIYTLTIEYGGEVYTAKEQMPAPDSFNFKEIPLPIYNSNPSLHIDGVQAEFDLSIESHHFGYSESKIWKWTSKKRFTDTANLVVNFYGAVAYSHEFADAQGVYSNIRHFTSLCYDCEPSDTLMVIGMSISDGYGKYLQVKFNETIWKESYFASQPGNLPTNMSKGALGYFYTLGIQVQEISIPELRELGIKEID